MRATLEPVVWIIRFHEDAYAELGAPYTASATIHRIDHETAAIAGMTAQKRVTKPYIQALVRELAGVGITKIKYSRLNSGRDRKGLLEGASCTPLP